MQVKARAKALSKAWRQARWVREHHGKSTPSQLAELIRLRRHGIKLSTYYTYCLFDDNRFPDFTSKAAFRSYKLKDEFRHFSDPKLQAIAYQKHVLYRLLGSFGFPVPRIHALYSPLPDGFERHRALRSPRALRDWLRQTQHWPLFGKPSDASHGYGALGMVALLPDERVRLLTDEIVGLDRLVAKIDGYARRQGTYLICEMLRQRDDIAALCGSAVASIRIVTLVRDGEPELMAATILLPRDKQHISNARGLTTGNLGGKVELDTGRIHAVIDAPGPEIHFQPRHPDTGALVEGHVITDWHEVTELVLEASRALSPFRMQHWDLALTARGPVILEMNFIGDVEPMQLYGPPGAYTEQYRTFAETQKVW